ncbi:NADAR family protein [Terasakiella pusilla]|uniref:NADAR family protein n=1 Tax=Terasakiella pusilla TaxID=64973 RepID=UPI003AA81375
MLEKNGYTFFWGRTDVFSQWYPSAFEYEGLTFVNCEQFMMYSKAKLFNDDEIADEIMKVSDPKEHKAFGRKVRNFDTQVWNAEAKKIVYIGNREKFTQNEKLLAELMATGDTKLVEASPYDKIWGIGLESSDPAATDPTKWKGTNWLGEILTTLRDDIRK